MAKGWESKSVEEQQSASQSPMTDAEREVLSKSRVDKLRAIQSLKLSRARVLQLIERSANERYTQLLKSELAELDQQLSKLGS